MDLEHLGADITGRYFRNGKEEFKIEESNFEIPKIEPSEAFPSVNFYEKTEDNNDVPF